MTCDDGNVFGNDGCSSLCEVEKGWDCIYNYTIQADQCFEICGDGLNKGQNQCDDGNLIDRDGCSSNCKIERGFYCVTNPKSLTD